jgi:hypothetical protein
MWRGLWIASAPRAALVPGGPALESAAGGQPIVVAASINPLTDFARQVGGGRTKQFIAFDPEMTEVSGIPADGLYVLLLSVMAVTIVLALKVVGIILVSAMLVIPAAAYQLTEDFWAMMAAAVLIGSVSAVVGLVLSYRLDTASGATMVLTATAVFFLAALLSPRR